MRWSQKQQQLSFFPEARFGGLGVMKEEGKYSKRKTRYLLVIRSTTLHLAVLELATEA